MRGLELLQALEQPVVLRVRHHGRVEHVVGVIGLLERDAQQARFVSR